MKLKGRLVLLGTELKTSAKGNEYCVGLFQNGTDTIRSMVKMEKLPDGLQCYKEYDVEFNYSAFNGQIRLDVTDIRKIAV